MRKGSRPRSLPAEQAPRSGRCCRGTRSSMSLANRSGRTAEPTRSRTTPGRGADHACAGLDRRRPLPPPFGVLSFDSPVAPGPGAEPRATGRRSARSRCRRCRRSSASPAPPRPRLLVADRVTAQGELVDYPVGATSHREGDPPRAMSSSPDPVVASASPEGRQGDVRHARKLARSWDSWLSSGSAPRRRRYPCPVEPGAEPHARAPSRSRASTPGSCSAPAEEL